MAEYADRVVTELLADTSGHDPKLLTSARVTEQAGARMQRSVTATEASANRAFSAIGNEALAGARSVETAATQIEGHTKRMGASGAIMQHVVRASVDQFAAGAPVATIFAQHISMVGEAAALSGRSLGGFGAIMSGPWGIAVSAGIGLLATLIPELFDTRTELEKATDKLGENAAKADLARQAQEQFARTLPGATQAIRDQTEALRQQNSTLEENQDLVLRQAFVNVGNLAIARDAARRELAAVQQQLADARVQARSSNSLTAVAGAAAVTALEARVASLQHQLRQAEDFVAQANANVRSAMVPIVQQGVDESLDRRAAETGRLRREEAALRAQYEANAISLAKYTSEIRKLQAASAVRMQQIDRDRQAERSTQRTLTRPTAGAILSPYGADRSGVPLNGRLVSGRRHEGVDFRGNLGDPVVAPEAGTATVRNRPGGLGLYVEIRADSGARNLLGHLSAANVRTGDRVAAGDLVGLIGNSGNARGGVTHLHYQRIVNGRSVDPTREFGASGAAQSAQAATNAAAAAAHRAAEQAAQMAERRQVDEDQFQQQLAGLNADILNARRRQVQTEEEAADADIAAIRAEQSERDTRIQAEAAARIRRDATQAFIASIEAATLLAKSEELTQTRIAARRALEQQRLDEQRIDIAQRDLNDQESVLRARGQLARTAIERRDIELRLLALQHQEELLAIQKQRAQQGLTRAQIEQLDRQEAALNTRYGLDQQNTIRQTAGPLEAYFNAIPKGAAEMNEALQEVAVHGLASLNDGLAQAATNFLHLGGVAGNILNQILSDLIRIGLQQAEMAAFGGGKGGGLFSVIGQALGIASTAAGGGGGFDPSAFIKDSFTLFGHADGYVGPIGGVGGRDNNILSINGVPRARVSGSETLAIIPQGASLGYSGGSAAGRGSSVPAVAKVMVELHGDIDGRIATVSGPVAVEVVRAAAPGIISGAKADTIRSLTRPMLNR